jgi:hypothetical protein
MNQELENRVNEIILEQNLSVGDALKIAQTEQAEEEIEETEQVEQGQKKNSNSSAGTFSYIGEVEQPEISPLLPPASRQFAISQYEAQVEDTNLLVDSEFNKLKKLAAEAATPQERADLYSQFVEETGVAIPEENFVNLESAIVDYQEKEAQFQVDYQEAFNKAVEQDDFSVASSVLEQYGFEGDEISEMEKEFRVEQDKRTVTQGQVLEAWKGSYTAEELQQNLDSVNISQEEKDLLIEDYNKYLTDLGEGVYSAIFDRAFKISQEIAALGKDIEEYEDTELAAQAEEQRQFHLRTLRFQYDRAREAEAELVEIARQVPQVKPALAMIQIEKSRFIDALDESVRDQVRNGDLDMYEAAWLTSNEYKEITEATSGVLLDKNGTPYREQESKKEAMIEEARERYVSLKKEEQTRREIEVINKYVPVGDDPDEKKALENAILRISGNGYDLENIDGKVGYETPWLTDSVLKFTGALVDFFPSLYRTGMNARFALDQYTEELFSDSEEESELIRRKRELRTEAAKTFVNLNALESAREVTTQYENGIMESFRKGNWEAGIAQAVGMAAESLPITLATMVVSGGVGTVAGYGFASAISAGLEYEEVFQEEWFQNLSPLERSIYIGGVGAAEGLSESIGAGIASRFLKGGSSRAIGQLRNNYLRNRTKGVLSDYVFDAGSEVGVTYTQAGLEYAFNEKADLSNLTDDAFESAIVSFITTGGMQTAGTINTVMSASNDPDVLFSGKDVQKRINDILKTTTPGSKTRVQQIELMMEDASVAAQIKADAYEFHEFIRQADPEVAQAIADNSVQINAALRTIETSTNKDEIKEARQTVEELINENKSLEMSMVDTFYSQADIISEEAIDKLKKRAINFSRQATNLQRRGNEAAASSLRSRAERIKGQLDAIELRKEISTSIQENEVISSEGRDARDLAEKIEQVGSPSAVVDAALAEQLEKMGYAELQFDASSDGVKLMVKGAQGIETTGGTVVEALEEASMKKLEKEGSATEQDLVFFAAKAIRSGVELTAYQQEVYDKVKEQTDAFVSELEGRRLEDLQSIDPIPLENVALNEAAQAAFGKLSAGLNVGAANVVSEREIFRQRYQAATTLDQRQDIADSYMNGTTNFAAAYDRSTGEILLTEKAQVKDVVEEFAHAYIHQRLGGVDKVSSKFTGSLMKILKSDAAISQAVREKMAHYTQMGFRGFDLQEEMLVEVFAQYVANAGSVSNDTRSGLQRLFDSVVSMFSSSGGDVDSVMRKLSETLLSESEASDVRESFEELFGVPEGQQELVNEAQQLNQAEQELMPSSRRPSFLDNKTVTFSKMMVGYEGAIPNSYGGLQKKTFNDYYHFVNWYRKVTGNGRFTRVGQMSYVDDNGNVRRLKAPKPLLDKQTGKPVFMEAAMPSYQQGIVDQRLRATERRRMLQKAQRQSFNAVADQLHDIILREKGQQEIMGGTRQIIGELMSDFTERGTLNEESLDAYGRPQREKQEGTPEYQEQIIERTNEWLENNYPGNSILLSSTSNKRMVNNVFLAFGESDPIRANQKRKNLEAVLSKIVGSNDPAVVELRKLMAQQEKGKLGGAVPRALINAAIHALDVHIAGLDPNMTVEDRINSPELNEAYINRLIAMDNTYDKSGRYFYRNYERAIDDLLEEAGTIYDSDGNKVDDPELMALAKRHKDLFTAIVAITSNGSKAEVNLSEALAVYHVALDEFRRTGAVGPRTKARIELIERQYVFTNSKATPSRGKNIASALNKLLGIGEKGNKNKGKRTPRYHFDNPGYFKGRVALKDTGKPGDIKEIAAQEMFGPKIGAFMANLYGRKDVFTQDLHVVESLNRVYRPIGSYSVDTNGLLMVMSNRYSQQEIDNIFKKEGFVLSEKDGVKILDHRKVKSWISRESKRRDNICEADAYKGELRRYLEEELSPARKPKDADERRQNIQVANNLLNLLRSKKGYSTATMADLGQMIFLENHAIQNALGASGRTYDAFSGETVEAAREGFRNSLVMGFEDVGLTGKAANQMTTEEAIMQFPAIQTALDEIIEANASLRPGEAMLMFSSKKPMVASNHPQSRFYVPSEIFKGRKVSMANKARFKPGRININKLVEGRATEAEAKYNVKSFGDASQFDQPVDGVMFMRNPLYADAFVDAYGNRLKYADNVMVSGDMIIASGKIRLAEPTAAPKRDDVHIESPEHFVAFQNFVSIMQQRNQSLIGTPPEMFEQAYKNLTSKERARFANLTLDEYGNVIKGRKLRGTSKRVASSSEYGKFKAEIINNPNNYIDRQKIADEKKALEEMSPQELVSLMRGDALNNLATRNDDVGVLAGIELINRLQAEGNDIGIVSVLDQLAAVGTTAGRVLRHMAELKTSSPQGMASVIIKKAEMQGKILSEAQKKEILDATKEYMRAYKMAEKFMERGIAGEDVENLFKRAQEDLSNAERDLDTLANKYVEKSWAEIGQQLVQGNLLTMMSQARNVVYNVANILPKTIVDIMSMPTSKAFELLGLHKEQRKLSLAGYLYAMRKFGAGTVEAMEQVITGREKDLSEWRMSRGFMPIRSLMHAMSTDLPEGQTMRDEFNQRAKLLVQGTFGIPAEAMFRLLSLGDVPFRRFAEGLELYNVGRGKGLEGEALAQFLKFPDKDSADLAATEGRKLTFQEPMGLARGSMWIIDNISRGMGQAFKNVKGFNGEGFFKFLIRLNVPYVSTIANFTEETLTYASPVFGGGKMAIQMGNGEYTEASKTLTKVMVGQAVSTSALYLISQGLLSGSVDWEDDEKTNLMYDTFPPNSINVSGLRRLMNGEDPSPQAGDEFRSYQTLGVFGTIMGAYAHSTTPEAAKEMAEQPFSSNNALKKLFGFENVSVVAYMMDQSFLQGLNGITSVIASTSDPDDFERAFFRYVETISKAFSSMFLPNVLSGVDQATREFLPDKRDKDLADRIKNHVRERTFNTGGLPVKVNWKGERIEQAPVGGNQFAYYMFDATKKKEASQDEVSLNILNLYLDTGVLTKAVGTPYYASSVYRKLRPPSVSRGKAKKAYAALGTTYQFIENPQEDFFVRLTAEEINNALEMTNRLRYNDIQAFMQTEDYQGMSNNEKIEALDEINDRYKSLLSYNPDGSFMEHSKYVLGIMERRYLEQYGQN